MSISCIFKNYDAKLRTKMLICWQQSFSYMDYHLMQN
jgi:hypothetical protein